MRVHYALLPGVLPAAQKPSRGGGGHVAIGVIIHADGVESAACLGRISGALVVAGGRSERCGIVLAIAAEALRT